MQTTIQPIMTRYKGYRMRSRLEARYAVFLDHMEIPFEYEPEGFQTEHGGYLPDFFLPTINLYLEVKPPSEPEHRSIYLAGKMGDWRDDFCVNSWNITGPDKDAKHSPGIHGRESFEASSDAIVSGCVSQIHNAYEIFAWIDGLDAFGTFAEIGMAHAMGRKIYVAVHECLRESLLKSSSDIESLVLDEKNRPVEVSKFRHDLWFLEELSDKFVFAQSAQRAFDSFFPTPIDELKAEALSTSGKRVAVCHGDPKDGHMTMYSDGHCWIRRPTIETAYLFKRRRNELEEAAIAARSARFEHGENGAG